MPSIFTFPSRRRITTLCAAAALGCSIGTAGAADVSRHLPELGSSASALLSPARERKLGQAFMRQVHKTEKVIMDPALQDYIQSLGERLVAKSDAQGEPYHFFMLDNPQINAFAGPGGYIGIYTGLILTTETEGELAAVVAHEIAHVTQRHLLRSVEAAQDMSLPAAATILAAVALGLTVGGDAAMAAAVGGQAGLMQQQINFTRTNEQEADRLGVDTLAGAGYDPRHMPAFFSRMAQANRAYSSQLPELLLTHPVSDSRMADTLSRAESYPRLHPQDDMRYQLVRARLTQARIADPAHAVRDMRKQLEEGRYRNESAARYALALALQRQRNWEASSALLDGLLKQHPQQMEFVIARAAIEQALNRFDRAAALLAGAVEKNPTNVALNLVYAENLLNAGDPVRSETVLLALLRSETENPAVYALLSRSAGARGNAVAGHDHLAQSYYHQGQLDAAILQLEIALKREEISYYDSSRLEARLADYRREKAEAAKSKR